MKSSALGRALLLLVPVICPLPAAANADPPPGKDAPETPGAFRVLETGPSAGGGTHYLATAGDPTRRCAFHILIGPHKPGAGGGWTAAVDLLRHPHADCTALLDQLAGEAGPLRPARSAFTPKLTGSLTGSGPDQGPRMSGELALSGGRGALMLEMEPRGGTGRLSPKGPAPAADALVELAKLWLPDAPAIAGGKAWEMLGKSQRKRVMRDVVQPRMNAVFRELDPIKYWKIDCRFCHGKRAERANFKMPNPELPTLDFANKLRKEKAEKAAATTFMFKHVVPEMMLALGVAGFDTRTGQGFGCQRCHTVKN